CRAIEQVADDQRGGRRPAAGDQELVCWAHRKASTSGAACCIGNREGRQDLEWGRRGNPECDSLRRITLTHGGRDVEIEVPVPWIIRALLDAAGFDLASSGRRRIRIGPVELNLPDYFVLLCIDKGDEPPRSSRRSARNLARIRD